MILLLAEYPTNSTKQSPFLRSLQSFIWSRNSPPFNGARRSVVVIVVVVVDFLKG
jgi:hypothetical protein